MNRAKLFGRIAEKGFNLTTLSKALKMPYQTLYRKINGETEFTVGEAEAVCEVLGKIKNALLRGRLKIRIFSKYTLSIPCPLHAKQ